MIDIESCARILDDAARTATAIDQFDTLLTAPEAYAVQKASLAHRATRGEKRIGMKMGFTSRAKMIQMSVSDLIWGRLTDKMLVEEGGSVSMDRFIHPRVEPEVAFLIGKPLSGTVSMLQAQAAVEAVAPAMEIIDSRYRDFKFSLGDVIADNASSSGLVIGPVEKCDAGYLQSRHGHEYQRYTRANRIQCGDLGAPPPRAHRRRASCRRGWRNAASRGYCPCGRGDQCRGVAAGRGRTA